MVKCKHCQQEFAIEQLRKIGQSYFCPLCNAYLGYIEDIKKGYRQKQEGGDEVHK